MNRMKIQIGLILATVCSSAAIWGQDAPTPLPSQLAGKHTVFIASAGAPGFGRYERIGAKIVYDRLYAAVSKIDRYQLCSAPAQAEIAMEITLQTSVDALFLRLSIYDVKTHTLLWAIDEPIGGAFRIPTFERNADASIALLMDDLNNLASGKQPAGLTPPKETKAPPQKEEPTKTRLSQEK